MTRSTKRFPICAAFLAAACAGAPARPVPAYLSGVADHPQYPRARFITGRGISNVSADDAVLRGKKDLAAQIAASLQSESTSFQKFVSSGNGEGRTAETVTEKIDIKVSWNHAELEKTVETQAADGAYYALVALDRAEADARVAQDAGSSASGFAAAVERALSFRRANKTAEFAVAADDAGKLQARMDASFVTRRAILNHPAEGEADYKKSREALIAALEDARSRRVVGVVLKGQGSASLNKYAMTAVKSLGLRGDHASCEQRKADEAPDATELDIEPTEECGEASLGERCEVQVKVSARGCSGGVAGEGTVGQVRGVHPSDRERARRSAWDKVTEAAVQAAVSSALKGASSAGGDK